MIITKQQKEVQQFTSQSGIKPVLTGVLFDGKTAVATDSFRLVEITNDSQEPTAPMLLSAKTLKAAKVKAQADINREGERIVASSDTGDTFILTEPDNYQDFPKYHSIFPTDEPIATISLNGRYLAEVALALSKLGDYAEKITLEIHGPGKPIVFKASSKTQSARALLMPVNR